MRERPSICPPGDVLRFCISKVRLERRTSHVPNLVLLINWEQSRAHNPDRATPILGPCHGVFTDQFIFRHIIGHFFPRKSPPNLWGHSKYKILKWKTIRYQKAKNIVFTSEGFAGWFVEFKRDRAKTVQKVNWSMKTPWHESGSYSLRLMGSWNNTFCLFAPLIRRSSRWVFT